MKLNAYLATGTDPCLDPELEMSRAFNKIVEWNVLKLNLALRKNSVIF